MQSTTPPLSLLILGGTTDASKLARLIKDDTRFQAVLSLAGRTRSPKLPEIPYRIGGFGGVDGLVAYIAENRIDAVVDATHPFAAQMTENAAKAAPLAEIPLLRIDRPPWRPVDGDDWTMIADMIAAAQTLGDEPRRVFLTIGQKDLAAFRQAPHHWYLIRSVDPPDDASRPPNCEIISATGPFDLDTERRLLAEYAIDTLVTKNSGGTAVSAKLEAARERKIPVIMVERPQAPKIDAVPDADGAMSWLKTLHGAHATISPTLRGV